MAVKTLQLFESYLPNAQNWAFRTLNNLPNTEVNVAAYKYYNEQFVTPNIHLMPVPDYVQPQLLEGKDGQKNIFLKIFSRIYNQHLNEKLFEYITQQALAKEVDILHTHFANMGWHYLPLKRKTGLPFLVSFYGFDYENLPYSFPVWKKRYAKLFEEVDGFVCEGPFGGSILERQGCDSKKIHVVPLGVETDKIPAVARTKNSNELHLLQVCNYSQKKGHIYSLMSFIEALKTCPNMTLTFVGSELENIKQKLVDLIAENNVGDKVVFINFIDFSKLYEFFGKYHVFIHPSCYADNRDCEGGAPIVLLDAQCTGMPVIATTHCDIPEEVIHNKTGLLTPEKDVSALAKSIEVFYGMNNETYQQFASAARYHVMEKFNIQYCANQLQCVYDSIIRK